MLHGKNCDLAPNTQRNYNERYKKNIQPVMGLMQIVDVKPMHCKMVFNIMNDKYAGSTIRQTYICMGTMFRAAVNNGIINKHPMDGIRFSKPLRDKSDIHFLTIEEQRQFLAVAQRSHNYRQYALILEAGLRTGELIGLTFDAINWEKRTLTVSKTEEKDFRFESYDTHLYKLCDEAGIERFCMHALGHTYATKAIENGMPPKVLQKLLGHANLSTTMDRYVHVTDESLTDAVKQFNLSMRSLE